jgi:hypothetical protein
MVHFHGDSVSEKLATSNVAKSKFGFVGEGYSFKTPQNPARAVARRILVGAQPSIVVQHAFNLIQCFKEKSLS